MTITDTTITGNNNEDGGAVMVTDGTLVLTDSTVSDNTTVWLWRGRRAQRRQGHHHRHDHLRQHNEAHPVAEAPLSGHDTITDSVIDDNTSGYLGGGVYTSTRT